MKTFWNNLKTPIAWTLAAIFGTQWMYEGATGANFGVVTVSPSWIQILVPLATFLLPLFSGRLGPTVTSIIQAILEALKQNKEMRSLSYIEARHPDCQKTQAACKQLREAISKG